MSTGFFRLFVLFSVLLFFFSPAPALAHPLPSLDLPRAKVVDLKAPARVENAKVTCAPPAQPVALAEPGQALPARTLVEQQSNPTVNVRLPLSTGWSDVFGKTTPSTPVTLRVLRADQPVGSAATISDAQGDYRLMPTWTGCGAGEGWDWSVAVGDVVEVSAGENVTRVSIVPLQAWVDPAAHVVSGTTQPGWAISAVLYPNTVSCALGASVDKAGSVDSAGAFSIDYAADDLDRSAAAYVFTFDAQGNSVYGYYQAFHLLVDLSAQTIHGSFYPGETVSITWSRNDQPQGAWLAVAESDGSYTTPFETSLFPGDTITALAREAQVSMQIAPLMVTYAPGGDNQISGETTPGARVRVHTGAGEGAIPGQCAQPGSGCGALVSDENGAFNFAVDWPLMRGEPVRFVVYDAQGNQQQSLRPVPLIVADLYINAVTGFWGGGDSNVDVTVLDINGAEKETLPEVFVSPRDGSFSAVLTTAQLAAGDSVQVTGGERSETMTVAELSAALDVKTKQLTGAVSPGALVVNLVDFRLGTDEPVAECQAVQAGGAYTVPFSAQAQVGGQDYADVYAVDAAGHLTYRYAPSFEVMLDAGGNQVVGYTSTPGTPVSLSLVAGETVVEQQTATSGPDFSFAAVFATPFAAGLRVVAVEGDGAASAEVTYLPISFSADPAANTVSGAGTPNQLLRVVLRSQYACGSGALCSDRVTRWPVVGADGNFQASFADAAFITSQSDWERDLCTPARVDGACTRVQVFYYQPDENGMMFSGPLPAPVGADSLEEDDSPQSAKTYAPESVHTFHVETDADWISFTVSAEQVGQLLTLETLNLGRATDTVLSLYAADGATLLATDDDSGLAYASKITWIPEQAGTYLLQVSPFAAVHAANCAASYQVWIGGG